MQDVAALNADSDFKPFVARAVAPEVRNAAMKKLFADPHFNVMDGLDIYIDDYSMPDPLPASMLRKMASAKFLKLFDDDEIRQMLRAQRMLRWATPPVVAQAGPTPWPRMLRHGLCSTDARPQARQPAEPDRTTRATDPDKTDPRT